MAQIPRLLWFSTLFWEPRPFENPMISLSLSSPSFPFFYFFFLPILTCTNILFLQICAFLLCFSLNLSNFLHKKSQEKPNKISSCLCQERSYHLKSCLQWCFWQTNRCVYCNQWIIQAQKLQTSHLSVTDLFSWQT